MTYLQYLDPFSVTNFIQLGFNEPMSDVCFNQ